MPRLNRSDALAGLQPQTDVGLHLGGQAVPVDVRFRSATYRLGAQRRELGDFLLAFAAGPKMPVDAQPRQAAKIVTGVECQIGFVGMMHHDLLRLINLRTLVLALAIWERTVALEQSSRRATSSAGRSSTSRKTRAAR